MRDVSRPDKKPMYCKVRKEINYSDFASADNKSKEVMYHQWVSVLQNYEMSMCFPLEILFKKKKDIIMVI